MIEFNEYGVLRFKGNKIVQDVYNEHIDLNEIYRRYLNGRYTLGERFEFLALIGYSVDGWEGLLYQDPIVEKQVNDRSEKEKEDKIKELEKTVYELKFQLRRSAVEKSGHVDPL